MPSESRTTKSVKNAKVELFFCLLTFLIAFFSRKIFLDKLGAEFIGLTTTLQGLLNFLNLAELGIGTAISYVLYKPLAEDDRDKINEIVSILGYLYNRVGLFILTVGVALSFFIPLIFPHTSFSFVLIFVGYYVYLACAMLSYFINYRMTLLSADQKNYVVTKYLKTSNILQLLAQMAAALFFANLYCYLFIALFFSIVYSILLNIKIRQHYPWLLTSIAEGKKKLADYPLIKKLIGQLFIHKIANFSQLQLISLFISMFVSVTAVAYYGNYTTITFKLYIIFNAVLGSTYAGVGNLMATCGLDKRIKMYEELMAINFFITGFSVFMLSIFVEPFIVLWLGEKYLLSKLVVFLILGNFYFMLSRGTTDQFISGLGMYNDVWAPVSELVMFVILSVVGGWMWKLPGILGAGLLCKVLFAGIWKPFFLFHYGFKISFMRYLWIRGRNVFALAASSALAMCLFKYVLPIKKNDTFVALGLNVCYLGAIFMVIYIVLLLLIAPSSAGLLKRFRIIKG